MKKRTRVFKSDEIRTIWEGRNAKSYKRIDAGAVSQCYRQA